MFKNINRDHTHSVKWDIMRMRCKGKDVIPMWIADMEFASPKVINDAIIKRMKTPVYGYTVEKPGLRKVICDWHNRRYHYGMQEDSICFTNGVLSSLSAMINMCSEIGDKVVLPRPYYPNFEYTIHENERVIASAPMKCMNQRYVIDFDALEKEMDEHCKIFILCNPHNPSGTLYTQNELKEVADFCERHQLWIFSDEVHIDFVFNNQCVIPIIKVSEYAKSHTISVISSSKTFNLAGFKIACAIVEDEKLRANYLKTIQRYGNNTINLLAYEAMYAAYHQGESWVEALLGYIDGNRKYAFDYIKKQMKSVEVFENDATYLLWMDLNHTGIPKENLRQILIDEAKVMVSDGSEFHPDYQGFIRLNLGCSKEMAEEVLINIKRVVDQYQKQE